MKKVWMMVLIFQTTLSWGQSNLVFFDKDSYELTDDAKKTLNSIIKTVKDSEDKWGEIRIIGHTDIDANEKYNQVLSVNRSNAVKNYFEEEGLTNRFHLESLGENQLVNENENEDQKSKNRRVEIILDYQTNNSVYKELTQKVQEFSIDPDKDTVLICEKGTKIKLDKQIFKNVDYFKPITVRIQEYTDKSDFILSNLTTQTTSSQVLESRGMINIQVMQKDKNLELKKNKTVGILFKDRQMNDQTELFMGKKHDDEITWDPSGNTTTQTLSDGYIFTYISSGPRTGDTVRLIQYKYETIDNASYKITSTYEKGVTTYDTLAVEDEVVMKELMLSSSELGWINCDRFFKSTAPKTDLIVEYEGDFVPNMVLVFQDINSVLPYTYRENNKIIFSNIPADMNVKLVGLYKNKESKEFLFGSKETRTSGKSSEKIQFSKLSEEELKEKASLM